ncbi:MAG: flavin reductase family protein [archaeon]
MKKADLSRFHYFLGPRVTVIVTAGEKPNSMVASWVSPVSFDPPMVGVAIGESRFTHQKIAESGQFTISTVTKDIAKDADRLGHSHGHKSDKYKGVKLKPEKTPAGWILKGAAVNIACRLSGSYKIGDHTWFVGEVKEILVDEKKDDGVGIKPTEILYWRQSKDLEDTWTLKPRENLSKN